MKSSCLLLVVLVALVATAHAVDHAAAPITAVEAAKLVKLKNAKLCSIRKFKNTALCVGTLAPAPGPEEASKPYLSTLPVGRTLP